MSYINKVQVGSTTYDIQDARLENPAVFAGVVGQSTSTTSSQTLTHGPTELNIAKQWKVGQIQSTVAYATMPSPNDAATSVTVYFSSSVPSGGTRLYSGDLIYAFSNGSISHQWEIVPSADNPHVHSIPQLSGSAASNGDHYHTMRTLNTAGGHSHTVNVSASVTSGNNHSHTYTTPTQADSAGAHTHNVSIPTKSVDVTSSAQTSTGTAYFSGAPGTTDNGGGQTISVSASNHNHSYSKAKSGGTAYAATASVSGTTLVFTSVAAVSSIAYDSATSGDGGAHTHSITVATHNHGFSPSGSITWPNYKGTVTIAAYNVTAESSGAHTHALSGTSTAKNTGTAAVAISVSATLDSAGSHSHTFSGDAITTGTAGAHTHSVTTTANTTGSGQ